MPRLPAKYPQKKTTTVKNQRPTNITPAAKTLLQSALIITLLALLSTGCGQPKGIVFESLENPPVWPLPPETPRITYVGALSTNQDLKPAKSFFEGVGEALFGKKAAHGMIAPNAICTDGTGRVFISDPSAQLIHVFNLETRVYQQWQPGPDADLRFKHPVGIIVDSLGRLLVSDSAAGTIFVFDPEGQYLGHFGEESLIRPCGLAFDPVTNRLFVADTGKHALIALAIDGELIQSVGTRGTALGEFNFPTYVAVGPNGSVHVSDSLNFRVQTFDSDLNPIRQIGRKGDMPGYFALPKGLAVDSVGRVYVVDANFESVQVFDSAGRLLLSFGEEGHGPGQFWLPSSIFIDQHDRIWVSDSYNHRVQVFDPVVQPSQPESEEVQS